MGNRATAPIRELKDRKGNDKMKRKRDIVKLSFEIYFKETKECVGELSIRFKDENNYNYLSCTIKEISYSRGFNQPK